MEKFFYEHRPHLYLLLSFYAIAIAGHSALTMLSGFVLLACGLYVKRVRYVYRRYSGSQRFRLKNLN